MTVRGSGKPLHQTSGHAFNDLRRSRGGRSAARAARKNLANSHYAFGAERAIMDFFGEPTEITNVARHSKKSSAKTRQEKSEVHRSGIGAFSLVRSGLFEEAVRRICKRGEHSIRPPFP